MNKICRLLAQTSACHTLVNARGDLVWTCMSVCVLQVCQYEPRTWQDSIPSLSFSIDFEQPSLQDINLGETQSSHILDAHSWHYSDQVLLILLKGALKVYNGRECCLKIVAGCHSFTALPAQTEKLPKLKLDCVDGQCGVIWLTINMHWLPSASDI